MDTLEQQTPHYKGSQKTTPPKADHKHEYATIFTMVYLRRFDGSITEKKHRLELRTACVDCGHTNTKAWKDSTKIEVSLKEFRKLREEQK